MFAAKRGSKNTRLDGPSSDRQWTLNVLETRAIVGTVIV